MVPVAKEMAKYKKYARPFLPIRFLNLLPLSHMFGQSMATNIPPMVDGTVVFMRSFNPHDIVRRVQEWRISVIVCVPKILDVLREHALRIDPSPRPSRRRACRFRRAGGATAKIHRMFGLKFWAFIVGAAPLGPALEDFWKRLGFVVIQGYGLTETAPIVTLNHPFKTNTGSVGTPIGGVEVKIAEDGEILVRGENVTTGYFEPEPAQGHQGHGEGGEAGAEEARDADRPDSGRTLDAEGWLHTGDVGEQDAQGRLFIRGRKKEMIVTPEGLNVFPDDVERALERARRARVGGGGASRSGTRTNACTPCWCSSQARRQKRWWRRQRGTRRSSADPQLLGVDERSAAAHRRHEEAEARGDADWVDAGARPPPRQRRTAISRSAARAVPPGAPPPGTRRSRGSA